VQVWTPSLAPVKSAIGRPCRRHGPARTPRAGSAFDRGGEILEKLVRQLLGCAIDQPLAELGELAADLRFPIVGHARAASLLGERDRRAALGKAGHTAVALPRNLVAVRRVEV